MTLKNDRLLRALTRQSVDRTPVWMMRQAGRYLPEYRETRAQAGDFMSLCRDARRACEVTLQPLRRYELDAAILFSDILTIPDAMGLGLSFVPGEGPHFAHPVRDREAIAALHKPDVKRDLGYVIEAVSVIRRELNDSVPLIGFAGSPWTLATYMVEGGPSKDFRHIKGLMYSDPQALHALLELLATAVTEYLNAQILAGAQVVQIFDTWGGVLTTPAYAAFSLDYMQRIVSGLIREHQGRRVPVILFTKQGGQWLESIADSGCDAVGLDWGVELSNARERIGERVALQGNLDPNVLFGSAENIRQEVSRTLQSFGQGEGHVFNLGHGISQYTPVDNVDIMLDTLHELSPRYH